MKKNLNINLAGELFNIDEDAYALLEQYLVNMRQHFRDNGDDDEIMLDFEGRVGELLIELSYSPHRVVDILLVKRVIERMGQPQEIFDAEEMNHKLEPDATETSDESESNGEPLREPFSVGSRKLYRDPQNMKICGVLSGLSYYMGWNVSILRMAVLLGSLAFLFFGWSIPLLVVCVGYLSAWFCIPSAISAKERLEMTGEPVTTENIGNQVQIEFERRLERQQSFNNVVNAGLKGCAIAMLVPFFFILFALVLVFGFMGLSGKSPEVSPVLVAALVVGLIVLSIWLISLFVRFVSDLLSPSLTTCEPKKRRPLWRYVLLVLFLCLVLWEICMAIRGWGEIVRYIKLNDFWRYLI